MNALSIVKTVIPFVASFGVSAVVKNAIKATTPLDQTKVQKVAVTIGSIALSAYVGDKVAEHTTKQIEDFEKAIKSATS